MKFIFVFFALFLFLNNSFSQVSAQPYFISEKGSKLTICHYNLRSVPLSYTVYSVVDVEVRDSKEFVDLKIENFDKYKRFLNSHKISAQITDEGFLLDKTFIMDIDTLLKLNNQDYIVNGRDFLIPFHFNTGMSLISSWIEYLENDQTKYKVSEFARTIENYETVSTKIGDFDAWVVLSKQEINYGNTEMFTVSTYYSKGIGPVRINYYNSKRKLAKYSEIVAYEIPEKS